MKTKQILLLALLSFCALYFALPTAIAQGTAFTYQGQLNASNSPASGHYDFTFALFNNSSTNTGQQIGTTQTNLDVGVTNGLFIVTLSFGDVFTGTNYWLSIEVRTNGGASFTALSPLQELTPTPYAIYAPNAGAAASAGSVAAMNITGTLALDQLPSAVLTNGQTGVNLTGAFTGSGASLTNIPLSGLASDDSLALITNVIAFVSGGALEVAATTYCVIAATNLNGLGHVDLVATDTGTNTLTVLTNNGSGGFAVESTPAVGNEPAALAVGEVYNDGKPALISANYFDNTLTVLSNTGSGFVSNATLAVGINPISVLAVSNLNGLNHLDLVSANYGTNTLTVWTNNGSGKFSLNSTLTVGTSPASVIAADVTHLGRPDLICANNGTNTLTVLINIGGGEFLPETYSVGNSPSSVVAVDVNGDGWVDLVCANEADGTLTVLTNNATGNGSFTLASTVTMPFGAETLAVAYFNGNSAPDLVCSDENIALELVYNTGRGTFAPGPFLIPSVPDPAPTFVGIAVADINGDGRPDLVTADFNSNYLAVLLNESGLTEAELTLPGQSGGLSLSPGFFGVPNLIGGSSSNVIGVGVNGSVIAGGGSAMNINQIDADDSSISGGEGNTIGFGSDHSSIAGGESNTIENGDFASIVGGYQNTNTGQYAFIGAGQQNYAYTADSVIGGGISNSVLAAGSVVGGGAQNSASSQYAFVGAGQQNTAQGLTSVVGGGAQNTNYGDYAFIGAGQQNLANGTEAVIDGGLSNVINGQYGTIGGGFSNNITGDGSYNTVAGGAENVARSQGSTVGGGFYNQATQGGAVVSGGGTDGTTNAGNIASGVASAIGGGLGNQCSEGYATVGGGYFNTNEGTYTTLGGGYENLAGGFYATVPGGYKNIAGGFYSFAAGQQAEAVNQGAFVWADSQNAVFSSTANNQFNVRANGGVRFVTSGGGMTLDGNPVLTNNETGVALGGTLSGNGSALTNLTAANITPGGALPALNGASLTNLTAANIKSGGTLPALNGASLTSLNASQLSSGVVPTSVLPGFESSSNYATIGGGNGNQTTASYATVPGGENNVAGGAYSLAAGQQAQALDEGDFVWADSQNAAFSSTAVNQFLIRAAGGVGIGTNSPGELLEVSGADATIRVRNQNDPVGGFIGDTYYALQLGMYNPTSTNQGLLTPGEKRSFFGCAYETGQVGSLINNYGTPSFRNLLDDGSGNLTVAGKVGIGTNISSVNPLEMASGAYCSAAGVWTSVSDRNVKEDFTSIKPAEVLAKVAALPITQWKYKVERNGVKHLGPVAQDFYTSFGLGDNDKAIGTVDESGVALAAIQGLNQKLDEKDAEIQELKQSVYELKKMVQSLAEKK